MVEYIASQDRCLLNIEANYYNQLDIEAFSQMMKDPSYCYKFYWLEAVVHIISEGKNETTFDEIIDENWVLELDGVKERSIYYEKLFNHLCDSCTLDLEEAGKLYKSIETYGQEIENGICLVRGSDSFVRPFIHFTFLKQPMKWRTERVSVIIFINFSNEDFVYRSNVYRHLNYLISNVENVKKVKENPKFSLIYKMLHMNWVYDRIDLIDNSQLPAFEDG